MLFSIVISYLPYTVVTAFTPGPNNIVALYAVSQNGWRKGKSVLWGIAAGFLSVMVICALFCYELARYIPSMTGILKYVGAAYIVYLAVHVALSKPDNGEGEQMSFMKGFLLQFVNVKIILYAITVFTGYVLPHDMSLGILLAHAVIVAMVGVACPLWNMGSEGFGFTYESAHGIMMKSPENSHLWACQRFLTAETSHKDEDDKAI